MCIGPGSVCDFAETREFIVDAREEGLLRGEHE